MVQTKKIVLYELNPRYFKDDSGDGIGDLKGLASKFSYFQFLGVDGLILQDLLSTDTQDKHQNFQRIANEIGTDGDFLKILDLSKKYHIKIYIELNIGSIKENNSWFTNALNNKSEAKSRELIKLYDKDRDKVRNTRTIEFKYDVENKSYYALNGKTQEVPLNWRSEQVMHHFIQVIDFWHKKGVAGFVFKNFEYITDVTQVNPMSGDVLRELRRFYRQIKEYSDDIVIVGKSDVIPPSDASKYVENEFRIFDYLMLTTPSMLGTKNNVTDLIGKFKPRDLVQTLNALNASNRSLIGFGSSRVGRVISRWLNDGQYHAESCKSLFLVQMISKAANTIYYGDEIGTKNIGLTYLDDFMDPTIGVRKKEFINSNYSERDFMNAQILQNPINSRSPMAWNDEKNGGFSSNNRTVTPINLSYKQVNVGVQFNDNRSILNFNKELIALVKSEGFDTILSKGTYTIKTTWFGLVVIKLLHGQSRIMVFANLTSSNRPLIFKGIKNPKIILSSYSHKNYSDVIPNKLEPYESILVISNISIASVKNRAKVSESSSQSTNRLTPISTQTMHLNKEDSHESSNHKTSTVDQRREKTSEIKTSTMKVRVKKTESSEGETSHVQKHETRDAAKKSRDITSLKESQIAKTTLVDVNEAKDIEELIKKLDKKNHK